MANVLSGEKNHINTIDFDKLQYSHTIVKEMKRELKRSFEE